MKRLLVVCGVASILLVSPPVRTVCAEPDLFGGIADIVSGVFVLPYDILAGTVSGPPIIGTIGGALVGTMNALALTVRGTLRIAGAAVPIAMQAAPYVLPFVL